MDVSVIDQRDGEVHSVQVFKCVPTGVRDPQTGATCSAGDTIATVSSNGPALSLTPTAGLEVTVQSISKTPAQVAQEFIAFQATIDTYNVQKQIDPNLPQHTENGGNNNPNTGQTRTAAIGSTPVEPVSTDPTHTTNAGFAVQTAVAGNIVSTLVIVTPSTAAAVGTTSSVTTSTDASLTVTPAATAPTVTAQLAFAVSSPSGNVTSNDTLSGTGRPNTLVHFMIDGAPAATTVTTNDQGAWSFTPAGLTDGSHTIVASQTDALGNTGTASLSFMLDTTAPSGGTPNPIAASDTGSSSSDNITAATAPTFTVALNPSVAAGDTVQLLLGGSPLVHPATHVVTAADVTAGSVSLTVTAGDLGADGSKQVAAQFSDVAGNQSTTQALSFTLDTIAPLVAITSPAGPGNQAAQTITGTGEAGTTVTLFDNGTQLQLPTVTVDQNGLWSTNVTLANGSNSLTAQVTDLAGNTATSTAVVYTLSTTGPAVTESLTTDTGSSASDKITSNDALTGLGAANTVVTLKEGTTVLGTTTADDSGNWSFTPTNLADGTHTIVASQTDAFNNTGTASLSFTLDTTADAGANLAVSVSNSKIGNAGKTAVGFTVAGLDADAAATVTFTDAATHTVTANVSANGSGTVNLSTLADGAITVSISASDTAGNTAAGTGTSLTLDTTAPAVAITTIEGGDNLINASEAAGGIQISGTADTGSTLTVNGSAVTVDSSGNWTTSITPAGQGALVVTAVATDAAGNSSTATTNLTVDTVAPAVAITTIEGGDNLINASEAAGGIQISGTAEIGSTLTVNGSAVTVDGTGHWATSITPAGQGALVVTAVATDAAGNATSTTTNLTVDTIAPSVVITSPGGPVNQAALLVTGTVDVADAGATVTILDGAAPVGSAIVQADGSWSSNITLGNGSNSLTAKVSDLAGNTTTSTAVVYTLSTTGPTVTDILAFDTGSSAVDHITSNAALSGTGLANTVVHFTIDGIAVGATATADAQGLWSFTPTGLANGAHTIVASQTDTFNNTGTASLTFTLDTIAPAVAITTIEGGDNLINASEAAGGIQISGTAEIGSTLTVNGAAVTVDGSGHWTTSITPAGQGALVVTAVATDAAGNSSSTTTNLTVDTIAPLVAITSPGGPVNQAAQVTITVDVAEAGATVTLFDNGTAPVGSDDRPELTAAGATNITLSNGSNALTAQVSDAAGNTATSSAVIYTLSTTAPTVTESLTIDTGASNTDRISSNDALSGTGLANTVVHFTLKEGTAVLGYDDCRCARQLVVHADQSGRRHPHHRGQPDRCLQQHRHGVTELHAGHNG